MGACPECHNGGRYCTYNESSARCKPCEQLDIYCSGNFDSEEFERLRKLEKQHSQSSLDAMKRLEVLLKEVDELTAGAPRALKSKAAIDAYMQRLEQVESQMTVEERTIENTDRWAKAAKQMQTKMFQRELRALDQLGEEGEDGTRTGGKAAM